MPLKPIRLMIKLFENDSLSEADRSRRSILQFMEAMIIHNRDWLRLHPETPRLYESGVVYRPEEDTEDWQDIQTTMELGYADCEDLSTWRIAELNQKYNVKAYPYITWRQTETGMIYHALVRWPTGHIEDPSRALGMLGQFFYAPVFVGIDTDF